MIFNIIIILFLIYGVLNIWLIFLNGRVDKYYYTKSQFYIDLLRERKDVIDSVDFMDYITYVTAMNNKFFTAKYKYVFLKSPIYYINQLKVKRKIISQLNKKFNKLLPEYLKKIRREKIENIKQTESFSI